MKRIRVAAISLLLSAMLAINAAAMEVPTGSIIQNLNGVQQCIKTFTVLPGTDPETLIEAPFDVEGYTYTFSGMTKQENLFTDEKEWTETVTVTTDKKDLEKVLEALSPTLQYDDGKYTGTLNLDHTTIQTEAAGYETRSYTVSATKELDNLDSNDMAYVPSTTVKDGVTISLSSVDWQVQSTVLVGDFLVPATYKAVAYYSGKAYYSAATGYISTAEYKGTVFCSEVKDITYTVTYVGTPISEANEALSESAEKEDPEMTRTTMADTQISAKSVSSRNSPLLYVVGGVALLALLSGGTALALHVAKKREEHNDYNEEGTDEYDDA